MDKRAGLLKNELANDEIDTIFDPCIKAMMNLMLDSYDRFKKTEGFSSFEEEFQKGNVTLSRGITNFIEKWGTKNDGTGNLSVGFHEVSATS